MTTELVQTLLYSKSTQEVKNYLSCCSDSTVLHLYAYNYNWNDGFEIPAIIIENKSCTLETALTIFYLADGYRYLLERNETSDIPEWLDFIRELYIRIISGCYRISSIAFLVPLSKVQSFKLKKRLNEKEQIFITSIDGDNWDITL